jgi:hypothetical protein
MPVYCPFRKAEGNAEDLLYMRMRGSFSRQLSDTVFNRYCERWGSQIGVYSLWAQALRRLFMTEAERASLPYESPMSDRDPQRVQDMLRIIEQQCSQLEASGEPLRLLSFLRDRSNPETMENRTGVPRRVIASFIQQEMEANRQKNEEARAVLMSMFEALVKSCTAGIHDRGGASSLD